MLAEAIAVSLFTSDLYIEGAAEKEGFIGKYFPHSVPLHSHSMNSKKHWPSIFMKSKSSTSPETSNSSPLYPGEGALSHNDIPGRERIIPIAKTRWHPKPDQIEILEAIFNSGMVNPPREEIKRIRAQLQEFGHVEDVNVFYWFQNSKARSKRKRQLQDAGKSESRSKRARALSSSSSTSPSTSTSTSVQSQPTTIGNQPPSASAMPASSFAGHDYNQQANQEMGTTQYSNMQPVGAGETIESRGILNEAGAREDLISMDNSLITVFINDIPIQLPMGPINFHAFFGDIALLLDSSGHLVLVNESGFTMKGLEHGAKYFLI